MEPLVRRISRSCFDVLGNRRRLARSIADEVAAFLKRHALPLCRCPSIRGCLSGNMMPPSSRSAPDSEPCPSSISSTWRICRLAWRSSIGSPSRFARSELETLNHAWHKLRPLARFGSRYRSAEAALYRCAFVRWAYQGCWSTRARHAGLPWDMVFGADASRSHKPAPQAHLHAFRALLTPPQRAMLVASRMATI